MSPIRRENATKNGEKPGCKTDDLYLIHGYLRRTLTRIPELIDAADPKDKARVELIARHIEEVAHQLIHHHLHEDAVMWERLIQRAPEATEDVLRMKEHHQHIHKKAEDVIDAVSEWKMNPSFKESLMHKVQDIREEALAHLDDEEKTIKPLAAKHLTQSEWNHMAEMAMEEEKDSPRGLFIIGYLYHCAPTEEVRQEFWKALPLPAKILYHLTTKKKFEKEWKQLYS